MSSGAPGYLEMCREERKQGKNAVRMLLRRKVSPEQRNKENCAACLLAFMDPVRCAERKENRGARLRIVPAEGNVV